MSTFPPQKAQKLNAESWLSLPDLKDGNFDGTVFGTTVSVLKYVQEKRGAGPSLHVHTYPEIFIILNGAALFKIGDEYIEAKTGDVLYGPANVPHKFKNTGTEPLETLDIHLSEKWIQQDLPDDDPGW